MEEGSVNNKLVLPDLISHSWHLAYNHKHNSSNRGPKMPEIVVRVLARLHISAIVRISPKYYNHHTMLEMLFRQEASPK